MLYNTEAIVIRRLAYGETHVVVTLLTPEGKVSAMAKGAKKPQSRLAAGTQLCTQGIYSLYQGRGMGNINQIEIMSTRRQLHEYLDLAAYAAYFCELAVVSVEDRPDGAKDAFTDMSALLDRLSLHDDPPAVLARIWEAKTLRRLGVNPRWDMCVSCGRGITQNGAYSVRDGGLLCESCALQEQAPLLWIQGSVARVLHQMAVVPMANVGKVNLSDSTLVLLGKILGLQMMEFAGLSLKSRGVLESLNVDLSP